MSTQEQQLAAELAKLISEQDELDGMRQAAKRTRRWARVAELTDRSVEIGIRIVALRKQIESL